MASGAGKGNFGSKFRNFIGGKKKPKPKNGSSGSIGSGDSDDEGYMDPVEMFATEPPSAPKPPIPDYPPPFCPGSKHSPKMQRPYSSLDCSTNPNLNSGDMRDYAKSLDNSKRRPNPNAQGKHRTVPKAADDYSDPWDSKNSGGTPNPKPISNQRIIDNYMDPYDSRGQKPPAPFQKPQIRPPAGRENYIEPWDSKSQPRDVKSRHRDDYKDPWDKKVQESLPKSSFEEDDDYNIPYDAGKPSQTVATNGKKPPLAEMDDLYDVPYEEDINEARSKLKTEASRQHHMARPDEKIQPENEYDVPWEQTTTRNFEPAQKPPPKPAHKPQSPISPSAAKDDYDAPWEWSNSSLSRAFSNLPPPSQAQAAMSRERVDSSLSNQSKTIPHGPMKTQSSLEQDPPDSATVYKTNPSLPLESQCWYHGKISRYEAEALLKDQPDCSFLLRDSESSRTDYSLSLRNNNEPMHLKISCRGGKFILGQNSKPYESIPEVVHHYSTNTLNIRGAEQVKLIYPVIKEAMYFTVEPGT